MQTAVSHCPHGLPDSEVCLKCAFDFYQAKAAEIRANPHMPAFLKERIAKEVETIIPVNWVVDLPDGV